MFFMDRYPQTEKIILEKLKRELPDHLYYHSYFHVTDVLHAAQILGEGENISDEDMELLKVAVLFHDSGYTVRAKDHEKISCDIARKHLPDLGFDKEEIEKVCRMIMATRYPQQPENL